MVVGATNRLHLIDRQLLRSGRMDVQVYVGQPDTADRLSILWHQLSMAQAELLQADVEQLARETEGCCAADLTSLVRRALLLASSLDEKLQLKHLEYKPSGVRIK